MSDRDSYMSKHRSNHPELMDCLEGLGTFWGTLRRWVIKFKRLPTINELLDSQEVFICKKCDYFARAQQYVWTHFNRMHREEKGYNIKNCFEAAILSFSLTRSVDHHDDITIFQDPPSLCHNDPSHIITDPHKPSDLQNSSATDLLSSLPVNDPQTPSLEGLFNEELLATCKCNPSAFSNLVTVALRLEDEPLRECLQSLIFAPSPSEQTQMDCSMDISQVMIASKSTHWPPLTNQKFCSIC